MNDDRLQDIANRLTRLDIEDMQTICRAEEATIYTVDDLKNPELMSYIIEWLLDKIDY